MKELDKLRFFIPDEGETYKFDVLPYIVTNLDEHPEKEHIPEDIWWRFPYAIDTVSELSLCAIKMKSGKNKNEIMLYNSLDFCFFDNLLGIYDDWEKVKRPPKWWRFADLEGGFTLKMEFKKESGTPLIYATNFEFIPRSEYPEDILQSIPDLELVYKKYKEILTTMYEEEYECNPDFDHYCPWNPWDVECEGRIYISDGIYIDC